MEPIKINLVSPCHHIPLNINDLNEIHVVKSEFEDIVSWSLEPLCCGDYYSTEEEARSHLEDYKKQVFNASIEDAKFKLKTQQQELKDNLDNEIEAFIDKYYPEKSGTGHYSSECEGSYLSNY